MDTISFRLLKAQLDNCQQCEGSLPLPPRPIYQLNSLAKILIIGQAPGVKTHHKGRPFDDLSGERLRDWLGLNEADFYNEKLLAIMPMAFCYPGKVSSGSGDKAPPSICSKTWHPQLLDNMSNIELTLLIGKYASQAYSSNNRKQNLTEQIRENQHEGAKFILPHPSPRNNIWLSKNKWFETKTLPMLRQRIQEIVNS